MFSLYVGKSFQFVCKYTKVEGAIAVAECYPCGTQYEIVSLFDNNNVFASVWYPSL